MIRSNVRMKPSFQKLYCLALLLFTITACDNVFEYTPYSANVPKSRQDTYVKNLDTLQNIGSGLSPALPFRFALISDSHNYYQDFYDAITAINHDEQALFVIHGGDLTYYGILKEYNIFYDIMKNTDKPYFTVIGNHDFVANGKVIYEKMFGELNYSFVFQNCKFVFFNNNIWENNNTEPDFFWLNENLADRQDFDHTFVVAHIPPWGDQFTPLYEQTYRDIMIQNNVTLSIHGHEHNFKYKDNYGDGMQYLVVGSPDKRGYFTIDVFKDSLSVNRVVF
jgi:3',5'-cyclic-AMP phosphodiesterase